MRGMPLARLSTLASSSPAQEICKGKGTRQNKLTDKGCDELKTSIEAFKTAFDVSVFG